MPVEQPNDAPSPSGNRNKVPESCAAWSTAATHGSHGCPIKADTLASGTAVASVDNIKPDVLFSIQRWLAEKQHEGPWNGLCEPEKAETVPDIDLSGSSL